MGNMTYLIFGILRIVQKNVHYNDTFAYLCIILTGVNITIDFCPRVLRNDCICNVVVCVLIPCITGNRRSVAGMLAQIQ